MTDPSDNIFDDIDADALLEPNAETNTQLKNLFEQLDSLGDISRRLTFLDKTFLNGSHIVGHSVNADEEYLTAWGESEAIRSVVLSTASGSEYTYSDYVGGRRKLYVKKPGNRLIREVLPQQSIESSHGDISVTLRGTSDFMQSMQRDAADQLEADRLGVSKPTEGSLKEFIQSVQAALDSGPSSSQS